MFCAWHLLSLPRLLVRAPGIQNRQELAHAGRQRTLLGFARGAPALGKGFEHRLRADGHEGTHGQGSPPRRAPTPGRAGPPQRATVPMERSAADQGSAALAASRAQLREGEPQRPCTHRPHARDTAGPGRALAPDGARPPRGVHVVLQRRHALLEPGHRGQPFQYEHLCARSFAVETCLPF